MTGFRYVAAAAAVFVGISGDLNAANAADAPVLVVPVEDDLVAQGHRTEILAIGNIAENDSDFLYFSLRQSITGDIDQGFKVRADVARSTFDFSVGGTPTTGEHIIARLLAGYAFGFSPGTKITVYAGGAYRDREISPSFPFISEGDDFGFFGSVELSSEFDFGGDFEALAEYETIADTFYTSAFYVHPVGPLKVGPTANFLHEDDADYSRWAAGVRASIEVGEHVELTATGAYAEGGTGGSYGTDSSYLELQVRTTF